MLLAWPVPGPALGSAVLGISHSIQGPCLGWGQPAHPTRHPPAPSLLTPGAPLHCWGGWRWQRSLEFVREGGNCDFFFFSLWKVILKCQRTGRYLLECAVCLESFSLHFTFSPFIPGSSLMLYGWRSLLLGCLPLCYEIRRCDSPLSGEQPGGNIRLLLHGNGKR